MHHSWDSDGIEFQNVPSQSPNPWPKPRGLWYSCGKAWSWWTKGTNIELGPYTYVLDVDLSSMIVLRNEQNTMLFHEKFKHPDNNDYIDWSKVAAQYAGIEICPYFGGVDSLRYKLQWYYGWDVASGCIWNQRALKSIKRMVVGPTPGTYILKDIERPHYNTGKVFRS